MPLWPDPPKILRRASGQTRLSSQALIAGPLEGRQQVSAGAGPEAWEAEALGQGTIQRLVRDALLPEPLTTFWNGKQSSGVRVAELLDGLHE
ncbi:MAG TPA: hypothetical protein VNB87_16165 [Propionibacteriaceae bacterium]|nr:hypothetical protein [Propionibacteriaceae bacterium]